MRRATGSHAGLNNVRVLVAHSAFKNLMTPQKSHDAALSSRSTLVADRPPESCYAGQEKSPTLFVHFTCVAVHRIWNRSKVHFGQLFDPLAPLCCPRTLPAHPRTERKLKLGAEQVMMWF
jgi:hypothetical protein